MAEQNKAALLKKLHAVMQVVDHIEKRGQNRAQNYEYLMAEDVLMEVRQEFVKQGLVLIPACASQEVKEGQSKSGGTQYLTLANLTYSVYDMETGESITVAWQGQGQDNGDKGLYKAFTGGSKYFLRNLLMIPTGDDPENDGTPAKPRQVQQQPPRQSAQHSNANEDSAAQGPSAPQASSGRPASEKQINLILDERKRRHDAWKHIWQALQAKGCPDLTGRPSVEAQSLAMDYLKQLSSQEASKLIETLKALPFRSEAS